MKMIATSAFAICSVVTLLASAVAAQSTATASQLKQLRVLDCTLNSKSFDDCSLMGYAWRVGVFAAPGLLIGTLIILTCPLYCLFKYCCNCCGGKRQSPNFCCPHDTLPARYSRFDLLRPKILVIVAFLAAGASLAWGVTGNTYLVQGLQDFSHAVKDVPNVLQGLIDDISSELKVPLYDPSTGKINITDLGNSSVGSSALTEASKVKKDLKSVIDDKIGHYDSYVQNVNMIVLVFFSVPVGVLLIASLSSMCTIRKFVPMTLMWIMFLLACTVWLVHGMFCAAAMVGGDICAEVNGIALEEQNVIAPLLNCSASKFEGFTTGMRDVEAAQTEAACNEIYAMCYNDTDTAANNLARGAIFECNNLVDNCTSIQFVDLYSAVLSIYVAPQLANDSSAVAAGATCEDASLRSQCGIYECASTSGGCVLSGNLSSVGGAAKQTQYALEAAQKISNLIDTLVAKYANCDSVLRVVLTPFDGPCHDLVKGFVHIRQATGLFGLCCIASLFVLGWGAKRFIPMNEAGKLQYDGRDEVDLDG